MDQYVIHNLIEYINTQSEFPFDCIDVQDSIDDVLSFFGFQPELSQEEREEVRRSLLRRALSAELAEMNRLVELGADCHLNRVLATLRPYYGKLRSPSVSPADFAEQLRLL